MQSVLIGGPTLPAAYKYHIERLRGLQHRRWGGVSMACSAEAHRETARLISREDNWHLFRERMQGKSPHDWAVYAGAWSFWRGLDSLADPSKELAGMRCFKPEDNNLSVFYVNILSKPLSFGPPPKSYGDGWLWSEVHNPVTRPVFSGSLRLTEEDKLPDGRAASIAGRILSVTGEAYAFLMGALPLGQGDSRDQGQANSTGVSQPSAKGNNWLNDTYMHDGNRRWSLGAAWDDSTGASIETFMVREYERDGAEPTDPLPPARDFTVPAARFRLGEGEVRELMSAKRGRLARITFDKDGKLYREQEEGDALAPPLQDDSSYKMCLYPDKMFAHVPSMLPQAGSQSGTWSFTWGGIMSGAQFDYQQVQAKYCGITGRLLELNGFTR